MLVSPFLNRLRHLAGHRPEFWKLAAEIWEMHPAERREFPPALFLDGQLERITATVFGDLPGTLAALRASQPAEVGATLAARFRDVVLVDGVLYKHGAEHHLLRRQSRAPLHRMPETRASGAIYDSWVGLRYFGNWLMDDTETYRLAEAVGQPVTILPSSGGHRPDYERLLAMTPRCLQAARFEDMVLFADLGNNSGKLARAADRRARLLAGRPKPALHPGVFLLRGESGDPRRLRNEMQLAEQLEKSRGIRPIRAETLSVADLMATCEGAQVVIGVEGSQLTHALAVMPPGGALFALMPPDRVTAAMKLMTDRLQLLFALVVGQGSTDGFTVHIQEIETTLDLIFRHLSCGKGDPH